MTCTLFALFWTILLLPSVVCVGTCGNAKNDLYECYVTTPRLYAYRSGQRTELLINTSLHQSSDVLVVELNLPTHNVLLNLTRNRYIFAKQYVEKFYLRDGSPVVWQPHKRNVYNCYYHGYVLGKRNSSVALTTCRGLSGVIIDKEPLYIEPSNYSSGEHVVFRYRVKRTPDSKTCGVDQNTWNNYKELYQRVIRAVDESTNNSNRFIELCLVADHTMYTGCGRDRDVVVRRLGNLANVANNIFVSIGIRVAVTGIEVWSVRDLCRVTSDASTSLRSFQLYFGREIKVSQQCDVGVLVSWLNFGRQVGVANINSVCSKTGVALIKDFGSGFAQAGSSLAHEIGHTLGMLHDKDSCHCADGQRGCVMAKATSTAGAPTAWSSCSVERLHYAYQFGLGHCLHNVPETILLVCGNGIVESGEECDCSSADVCSNSCCLADTCTFARNAQCYTGDCCNLDTCSIMTGRQCRPPTGFCDLPEYCDERSDRCPADVSRPNGTICSVGGEKAYCFSGECMTLTKACRALHGPQSAPCLQNFHFNTRGDISGDCGYDNEQNTHKKCHQTNIYCGRLHCTSYLFSLESLAEVVRHYDTSTGCANAIFLQELGKGMVPNGVVCDTDKVCVKQECRADVLNDTFRCSGHVARSSSCMNGRLDGGEECDCGTPRECTNKCCDPCTCKMILHVQCAHGICCDLDTCQYKRRGDECRPTTELCDLPEYCSGRSNNCTPDRHKQDGTICDDKKICENRRCLPKSVLAPVCDCSGHGVCDNTGSCHCDYGYAPPECNTSGYGGSIVGGQPNSRSIDGSWSTSVDWSRCNATCGGGFRYRKRTCTNPRPQFGGSFCKGSSTVIEECNELLCQFEERWSLFSPWSECNATCGGGVQIRTRTCDRLPPQEGGGTCIGDGLSVEECNVTPCLEIIRKKNATIVTSGTDAYRPAHRQFYVITLTVALYKTTCLISKMSRQ